MYKKRFVSLFFILMICFSFILKSKNNQSDDSFIKKGTIKIKNYQYKYETSPNFVNIYDKENNLIFCSKNYERDSIILNFDYIKEFNSFFVFKQKNILNDQQEKEYELTIESDDFNIPIISHSKTPFYTPLLIENDSLLVLYITESFSIKIFNLKSKVFEGEIKFKSPVLDLTKDSEIKIIEFLMFYKGKYRKYSIKISDIFIKKYLINPLFSEEELSKKEDKYKGYEEQEFINIKDIALDYKKFVGFGDSITYGYVDRTPQPELGYIPRLQLLVNSQIFDDGIVISEGIPGEKTYEAIERFEQVIITDKGKYLLFHEGTNDTIHAKDIPVSSTIFNISYMMDKALEYDIQPILSTIIPRDPNDYRTQRERGIAISEGIRSIAIEKNIPLIDFWDIFDNYPESDGGYYSLTSDHVHPSEKGYQLMAEEWLESLEDIIKPKMPENITISNTSPFRIDIQWSENYEKNFSHYIIEFGYSSNNLDRTSSTSTNSYSFINFFFNSPLHSALYFRIQAVDSNEHKSDFTSIYITEFK